MRAPKLRVSGVSKSFPGERGPTLVLADIALDLAENEFVSLVGSSGCGKSTLLSVVAGLHEIDAGALEMDGVPLHGPGLDRGVVFQSYTLLPWLTARGNIEFALQAAGFEAPARRRMADEHLALVQLPHCATLYPSELSGGMKQRVAIARALSYRPQMLLMDEPFGALDALTRREMQELLTRIWEDHRLTVLFVTHDVEEAIFLSDRIVVMGIAPGRIAREFAVPLPRPRREEMTAEPAFGDLRRQVLRCIRDNSLRPGGVTGGNPA